jgi:hypothetical protein
MKVAMLRNILVAAVAAIACQKTSGESPPKPLATAANTAAHAAPAASGSVSSVAAAAVPEKPVCNAIEKSAYDLGPLDGRMLGNVPLGAIVDDDHNLDPFYAHLAKLARGKAKDHVRIAVYGDSNMTMDYITGAMRRLLQGKFGDAGHGYVAMGRPWAWYRHMDVEQHLNEGKWKKISTSTDHVSDGHYGFANVATETSTAGAYSWVGTLAADDPAPIGKSVSAIDVFYMKRPQGGSFTVKVDGEKVRDVVADGTDTTASFEHFDMPDGPHKLEVVVQSGNVRLFGATLERKTPSIIVDSLGTGALNYEQMLHVSDASRRPMLQRRKYDLIVFLIGTNLFAPGLHEKWMTKDIGDIEEAVPNTPILILSPPDIELHKEDTHSDPRIVALSKQLADIAKRHSWGFWDFRAAMGGDMSMIRFAKAGLGAWDLVHLTHDGGFLMGNRFAHALFEGFDGYLKAHPDAGCDAD